MRLPLSTLLPAAMLALALAPLAPAAAAEDAQRVLLEEMTGLLVDARGWRPAELELEAGPEGVRGALTVDEADARVAGQLPAGDIPVAGAFDPDLGRITLRTETGDRRGEILIEIAQTDRGALAALFQEGRNGRRGRSAGRGFFLPEDDEDRIEHMVETRDELEGWRPAARGGDCPPALARWLEEAIALHARRRNIVEVRAALETPAFAEAFGAPYAETEADDLKRGGDLIAGACKPDDPRRASFADLTAQMVANADVYRDHNAHHRQREIAAAWRAAVEAEIPGDVYGELDLQFLERLWRDVGLGGLGHDVRDLAPALAARREVLWEAKKRAAKLEIFDRYKDRFDVLIEAAANPLNQTPDIAEAVQAKLAAYLPAAAARFAEAAERPSDAEFMLVWARGVESGGPCPLADRDDCEDIAETFEDRVEDLVEDFADALEEAAERRLGDDARNLDRLAAAVDFARDTAGRYGALLAIDDLEDAWDDVTDRRRRLQDDLEDELLEELARRQGDAPLLDFEARYFFEGDLAADDMEDVAERLDAELRRQAPFRDIPGGDYLNALVNGDARRLAALDRVYMRGLKPFFNLALQSLALLNPSVRGAIAREVENLSAIQAVFGTYLLNYGEAYPGCLGPSPSVFRVTTSQDTVTTDSSGQEVRRVRNWTERDDYAVPRRLDPHFRQLWQADQRTTDQRFWDAVFNDGQTTRLVRAMEAAMDDHDCDSAPIKALEAGMIAYHAEIRRRLGRR